MFRFRTVGAIAIYIYGADHLKPSHSKWSRLTAILNALKWNGPSGNLNTIDHQKYELEPSLYGGLAFTLQKLPT